VRRSHVESRRLHPALILFLLVLTLLVLHFPLLRLPYFWDEAGYYVPAARDLLLTGNLIPHSTISNAHPPLVMAYLAGCWKIVGYAPVVTRTAMLLVAAFTLLGIFRLARRVANTELAVASTIVCALYPVFFAQSSLVHLDLAAAGLTFWGLHAYVEDRRAATALWFSLAVLAKETAILAPLALVAWELVQPWFSRRCGMADRQRGFRIFFLLIPLGPLSLWYAYHYARTGFVFGNPEFFRYNVEATLHPLRMLLAFLLRLWQTVGYQNLFLLTFAALLAMWRPPLSDEDGERPRIALETQFAFLAVGAAYLLTMAVVGGAALARYMLPVVPLVVIVCVSTLRRRVQYWRWVVAIVGLGFIAGWFTNPPYGFSLEDNLAYRDYVVLHENAEHFLEARYPMARALTAWPASDELTRPYLGYVTRPMRVVRIENFTVEQVMAASDLRSKFDVALVFSTKYQPPPLLLDRWPLWQAWKTRFFGYYRDLPPAAVAQILGGQLVYTENEHGQWVAVIEMEQVMEAGERDKLTQSTLAHARKD
jgi:4-amino-4-deoxy-L-arabinose transferase-like glycosyltransferase